MTQRTLNFLALYFDAIDENIEEAVGELKEAGIDPEESENRVMQMIKKKKAEIKIEKGKELKTKVEEIIKAKTSSGKPETVEAKYSIAARKLGSLDEQDIQSIKKDAELLEEIGKLVSKGKNES